MGFILSDFLERVYIDCQAAAPGGGNLPQSCRQRFLQVDLFRAFEQKLPEIVPPDSMHGSRRGPEGLDFGRKAAPESLGDLFGMLQGLILSE